MEFNLNPGMKGEVKRKVTKDMLASQFGSGEIEVLATPVMVGLLEEASLSTVDPELPEGYVTVGYKVNVKHLAPTPPQMEVRAEARLDKVEERKLTFSVEIYDEKEKIGAGKHTRFIVDQAKLQNKAEAKSNKE